MTTLEVKVFLYVPTLNEVTGRWNLVRARDGGGGEILKDDFGTEGAAKVLAATLNEELIRNAKSAVEQHQRRLLGGFDHAD